MRTPFAVLAFFMSLTILTAEATGPDPPPGMVVGGVSEPLKAEDGSEYVGVAGGAGFPQAATIV